MKGFGVEEGREDRRRRTNKEVLAVLPIGEGDALSPFQVFERLPGWERGSVSRRLSELVRSGLCRRVGTQGKSRYYLGNPYGLVPGDETRPRKQFTNEDDGMILEMRRQGMSAEEIASSMGMETSMIFGRLQMIGGQESWPSRSSGKKGYVQKAGMVRCLGPGCGKQFLSPDKCRIRICPACKARRGDYSSGLPEHFLTAI